MEPEEYELVFVSSSGELLARSSTLGSAHDVDLQSVIGLCEAVGDPDPEIVFPSMVMGDYVVDVAACFNVFCVSIMKKASLHVDRNSALNALMPLLALSLTARARKCAIQFDQLRMIRAPTSELAEGCGRLFAGTCGEYFAFMGLGGEVYGSFGACSRPPAAFTKLMVSATELVQVIGDSKYVTMDDCPELIGLNFLPYVKIVGISRPTVQGFTVEEDKERLACAVIGILEFITQLYVTRW